MVSRDVVLQTVKRMYSSGVDDATVKSTLRDIGMGDEEIGSVIAEAKGVAPPQKPAPEAEAVPAKPPPKEHEEIAKKAAEHVGEQIRASQEETALRETAVHATIAEQVEKVEEVSRGVKELQAMAASEQGPILQRIAALEKRFNEQQNDLGEVKAATSALQSLLKKILSTDRSILQNLEKKKR